MSCRTTKAGSAATTFLATYFQLEDCQATSIFHSLRRRVGENSVTDSELSAAYDELENNIRTSPHYQRQGLRERALARLAAARNENINDPAIRFAVANTVREGLVTQAVIRMFTSNRDEATRTNDSTPVEAESEFRRLVREHKAARRENPGLFTQFIENTQSLGLPDDQGTRYAVAVLTRGSRCHTCGQFIGLTSHACPAQASASPNTTALSVQQYEALLSPEVESEEPVEVFDIDAVPQLAAPEEFDIDTREVIVDIDEFQELYDAVKAQIALGNSPLVEIPYEAPGAVTAHLAAPQTGRSLGIELEVDFPDEDYPFFESRFDMARRMYQEGLSLSPYVERWHYVGDDRPGGDFRVSPGEWICEFDRSVDPYEGERGLEIKSQILYDEPDAWRNLRAICDIANSLGARPTERTGLHINLGAQDFSANNPQRHNRLLRLAAVFDDTLVRLSHNPASGAWHRGRAYCGYADVPPEGFTSVAGARARSNHYQAFNLGHMAAEGQSSRVSSRIEMRLWDGTTDFARIQSAVNVSLAMVELSKYRINLDVSAQPSGYHRDTFGTRKLEGETWTEATKTFRTFMGLYRAAGFTSEAHQQNLVALFAESRWPRHW